MNAWLKRVFESARELFGRLSPLQKGLGLAGLGLLLALALFFAFRGTEPMYAPLYKGLASSDREAVLVQLEEKKVPYRVQGETKEIWVPAEQVRALRADLASKGLPKALPVGFELFDQTRVGITEFTQRINLLRALQGELERTIETIEGVEQARVHLVLPDETLFVEDEKPASASVILKLKRGIDLAPEQVKGISFLMSRAVKGLDPKNVTIVDERGKVLTFEEDESAGIAKLTNTQFQIKRAFEGELERKLLQMLTPVVGKRKVLVSASAMLDFSKAEHTQETYDPDATAVRSEERERESEVGLGPPSPIGVPGVMTNVPAAGGQQPAQQQATNQRSKSHDITNYEVSKLIRHVVEPYGVIRRLTVGVLLDGKRQNGRYIPLNTQDLAKIDGLVRGAIGYDENRGDQIRVVNIPFAEEGVMNERELALEMARHEFWVSMFKLGIVALGLVLLVFFVVRPVLSFFFPRRPVEAKEGTVLEEGALPEEGLNAEMRGPISPEEGEGAPLQAKPPSEKPETQPSTTDEPKHFDRILRASGENPKVLAKALEVLVKGQEAKRSPSSPAEVEAGQG
ncbi:MAG: flagellar basal-body MS-ring/collar protein FliF [Nitrospirota bacterium]|nr:flagellar basal-body MS-ring/collar protein FliF [Nitrospirota bacterium]